jgi:hypothetical protein|tara:strand:- start:322 stop:669 length:348 start_codon:yes stop_codon:yes gene_type:complete
MAIPSGSGTEVLKRAVVDGANNTTTSVLTVPTDHIYTVLTITIFNNDSANKTFHIYYDTTGSNNIFIQKSTSLPAEECFVWNDRLVLTAGDVLKIQSTSTETDIVCSYIDQDWTT